MRKATEHSTRCSIPTHAGWVFNRRWFRTSNIHSPNSFPDTSQRSHVRRRDVKRLSHFVIFKATPSTNGLKCVAGQNSLPRNTAKANKCYYRCNATSFSGLTNLREQHDGSARTGVTDIRLRAREDHLQRNYQPVGYSRLGDLEIRRFLPVQRTRLAAFDPSNVTGVRPLVTVRCERRT